MRTDTSPRIHLKDYRSPDYLIDEVYLDIWLDPTRTIVRSKLNIRHSQDSAKQAPLELQGEDLEIISIQLDGVEVAPKAYILGEAKLTFVAVPSGSFVLEITTACNPSANTSLSGLYLSNGIYCTQCEAEGFRRITYFPDRPDVLATYSVRIEAPKDACPVLLSNGNPGETGEIEGTDRHFAVWHDPHPKPSYLFALVGGKLGMIDDTFETASGKPVDLRIYMEPGKEALCSYSMEALKRSMRWDETRFGLEYDLDVFMIVAVPDFNMGAMENKGLNIFNDKFILADGDTATDNEFARIEAIIAHEYFHNWTGNRVTCRDWFQLCLKEGLTVYRDQEFSSDIRNRTVIRIQDVRTLRALQFTEDAGPLAHPVRPQSFQEINNFYTATVYEKGAELVRMIASIVGETGFRKGMDLYFQRCDGTAATVEDFVKAFEDANGVDLGQFRLWYDQAGTPDLDISISHDTATSSCIMDIEQSTAPGHPPGKPLHIPLRLALLDENGSELDLELEGDTLPDLDGDILHIREAKTRINFSNISTPPVASLLRNFSAPVKLHIDRPDDDLVFLIRNDRDEFNRWDAAQTLAMRILVAAYNGATDDDLKNKISAFATSLQSILENPNLEPAYKAEFLSFPDLADIAGEIGKDVDPDRIAAARQSFRSETSRLLKPVLSEILAEFEPGAPYSPDPESAGKRALKSAALGLICATGGPEEIRLAREKYLHASNMTETMGALSVMAHMDGIERDASLDEFAARFTDNPLVMDKWFTLQAIARRKTVIEDIERLLEHPAFSLKTPNRVRALVGAFAANNYQYFHRGDGAGYNLVAKIVEKLDPINPQIAARLLGQFKSWQQLETGRQSHAEAALKRVMKIAGLSPDTSEMATRCLSA